MPPAVVEDGRPVSRPSILRTEHWEGGEIGGHIVGVAGRVLAGKPVTFKVNYNANSVTLNRTWPPGPGESNLRIHPAASVCISCAGQPFRHAVNVAKTQ
jgi:hypothetical protein